jgi:hypothetical protein
MFVEFFQNCPLPLCSRERVCFGSQKHLILTAWASLSIGQVPMDGAFCPVGGSLLLLCPPTCCGCPVPGEGGWNGCCCRHSVFTCFFTLISYAPGWTNIYLWKQKPVTLERFRVPGMTSGVRTQDTFVPVTKRGLIPAQESGNDSKCMQFQWI